MKIIDIQDYRRYYKSIRPVSDDLDENFIGNYYVDEEGSKQFGWFTMYYGDRDGFSTPREGVENFLKSFLEMARDTQAVYEFLQNAVDAGSSHFTMVWDKDELDGNYYLLVANNGTMFSTENVRSILNVGSSTKSADNDTIGQFGIGFKLAHRLVGKDNGLEELIDEQSGPLLFSWKNYEIQNIIDNEKIETAEVFKDHYNVENLDLQIDDAWLFKILVACFPCAPENANSNELPRLVQGDLSKKSPFSKEEFSTFSRWLKKNQNILSENKYKEGSIFFIKLGIGKHAHLGENNLREGVKFSLAVLKETENDEEKKRKKILNTVQINNEEAITFPELEYINLTVSKERDLDQFSYVKFGVDKYEDLTKEQQKKINENSDIEILFGFRPYNTIGNYFKGAPNFYLYFPLSEEVHNFNFILHCNAFYQGASRTFLHEGNLNEGGTNEWLFEVIIDKVDNILRTLSISKSDEDRHKFLHFYAALLTSGRSFSNTRRWIDKPFVDKLDNLLLKYIPVKKNNQDEEFIIVDNPEDVYIKKTNLDVDFKNIEGDKYWFYWDYENFEEICNKASQKLSLKDFTIFNLLTLSKVEFQRINSWLNNDYGKSQILLKEVSSLSDDEIKSELLRLNLFNVDLLHFTDKSVMSLNEFEENESNGYLIIYKTLTKIRDLLAKSNLKISVDNIDDYKFDRFFNYKQKRDSQLRGHTDLTRFFSKHIDEKFLSELNDDEKNKIFYAFKLFHDENIGTRLKELKLLSDKSGRPKKFKNLLASTDFEWLKSFEVGKDKYFDDYKPYLISAKEDIYQYIVFTYWREIFNTLTVQSVLNDSVSKDLSELYEISKWEDKEDASLENINCFKYKNEVIDAENVIYDRNFIKLDAKEFSECQDILHKYFNVYLPDVENLKFVQSSAFNLGEQRLATRLNKENLSADEVIILLDFFKKQDLSFFELNTIYKEKDKFNVVSRNSLHQFFVTEPIILDAVNQSNLKQSFVLLPSAFIDYSNDVVYNEQKIAGHIISKFNETGLKGKDLFKILKFASLASKKTFLESIPQIIINIDGTGSEVMNDYIAILGDIFTASYSEEDLDKISSKIKLKYGQEEIILKKVDSITSTVLIKDLQNNVVALSKSKILGLKSDVWFEHISEFHTKIVSDQIISAKSSEKLFKIKSESDNMLLKDLFLDTLSSKKIENSHQLAFLIFSNVFSKKEITEFKVETAYNEWQKLSGQYYFYSEENRNYIEPKFVLNEKFSEVVDLLKLKKNSIINYGQEKEDIFSTTFLLTNGADPTVLVKDLKFDLKSRSEISEKEMQRIEYLFAGWKELPYNQRKSFNELDFFDNWKNFLGNASPMFFVESGYAFNNDFIPTKISHWLNKEEDKIALLKAIGISEENSPLSKLKLFFRTNEIAEYDGKHLNEIHPDLLFKFIVNLFFWHCAGDREHLSIKNDGLLIDCLCKILEILHQKAYNTIPSLVYSSKDTLKLDFAQNHVHKIVSSEKFFDEIDIYAPVEIFTDFRILYPKVSKFNYKSSEEIYLSDKISKEIFCQAEDKFVIEKWHPEEAVSVKYCDKIIVNYKIPLFHKWYDFATRNIEDFYINFYSDIDYGVDCFTLYINNNYTLDYVIERLKADSLYTDIIPDLENLSSLKKDFIANIIHSLSQINLNNLEDDNIVQLKKFIEQQSVKEERTNLIQSLNNEEGGLKRYSFEWFQTYLELLSTFSDQTTNQPLKKITFSDIKPTGKDKFYLLSGNSTYLSDSIDDASKPSFKMVFKDGKKEIINLVSLSKQHQNLMIQTNEKLPENNFKNVFQMEIEYAPEIDLLRRLMNAFEKLSPWDDIKEAMPNIEYIYGPPGTGKTYDIVERITSPSSGGVNASFLILTPTNKAGDVIGERLYKKGYSKFLRLSGQTSLNLPEEYYTNQLFVDDLVDNRVLISTIHRLPYYDLFDGHSSERLYNYEDHWDYIVIDEASMVNLPYLVFAILKLSESNPNSKIIIAGDPMQIPPVPEVNDSVLDELDIIEENIYKMMGLRSFDKSKQAEEVRPQDKVNYLDIQYRSVPEIGNLFNEFSYKGNITNHRSSESQKSVPNKWKEILANTVNFLNVPANKDHDLFKIQKLIYSSYHLYSCILICEVLKYLDENRDDEKVWKIGIITPYKAQAILINRLKQNFGISSFLDITADTVHGFQGDECEIVFFVVNPNNYYYTGHEKSLLSKHYIYNVAISRAEDYLVIVAPFEDISNNEHIVSLQKIHSLTNNTTINLYDSKAMEEMIFGDPEFIKENSYVTTHDDINVFNNTTWKYYVKRASTAIDFQLNF